MKPTLAFAAVAAIATAIGLPLPVHAAMPVAHDCAIRDPVPDMQPTARRASATSARSDRMRTRTSRAYTLQASSLQTGHPRVRTGTARVLAGDRNLQGMLESAVGDIEVLTQVIGAQTLIAMRDAENARRAPAEFQARITVVFDDHSEAEFIVAVGHPVAMYVIGSARGADGARLEDDRCIATAAS